MKQIFRGYFIRFIVVIFINLWFEMCLIDFWALTNRLFTKYQQLEDYLLYLTIMKWMWLEGKMSHHINYVRMIILSMLCLIPRLCKLQCIFWTKKVFDLNVLGFFCFCKKWNFTLNLVEILHRFGKRLSDQPIWSFEKNLVRHVSTNTPRKHRKFWVWTCVFEWIETWFANWFTQLDLLLS